MNESWRTLSLAYLCLAFPICKAGQSCWRASHASLCYSASPALPLPSASHASLALPPQLAFHAILARQARFSQSCYPAHLARLCSSPGMTCWTCMACWAGSFWTGCMVALQDGLLPALQGQLCLARLFS